MPVFQLSWGLLPTWKGTNFKGTGDSHHYGDYTLNGKFHTNVHSLPLASWVGGIQSVEKTQVCEPNHHPKKFVKASEVHWQMRHSYALNNVFCRIFSASRMSSRQWSCYLCFLFFWANAVPLVYRFHLLIVSTEESLPTNQFDRPVFNMFEMQGNTSGSPNLLEHQQKAHHCTMFFLFYGMVDWKYWYSLSHIFSSFLGLSFMIR